MNSARNEDAQANLARILGIVFVALVVTILAVGLLRSLVPNWVRSRTSPIRGIEMTLEQIDNAKLVMSLERHLSADTTLTREQLQSYLVQDFWRRASRSGAEYRINPIGIPAEAVLKKRLVKPLSGSLPPRTIIRFSTNLNDYEVVQPGVPTRK